MTTIVTRAGKGSALTWTEGDANFTNLRDAIDNHIADTADAHDATAIGFTQTDGAARTAASKMQDFVSILDFPGADLGARLQAAYDARLAVVAANQGLGAGIYIDIPPNPDGDWWVLSTPVDLSSGGYVHIRGHANCYIELGANLTYMIRTGVTNKSNTVIIEDLTFKPGDYTATSAILIGGGTDIEVRNIGFQKTPVQDTGSFTYGIKIDSTLDPTGSGVSYSVFSGIRDTGGTAITTAMLYANGLASTRISDIRIGPDTTYGVHLVSTGQYVQGNYLTNIVSTTGTSTTTALVLLEATTYSINKNTITALVGHNVTDYGVKMTGAGDIVENRIDYEQSGFTTAAYDVGTPASRLLNFDNIAATYTPTWVGAGSSPSLGDGTITGSWVKSGKMATVTINLAPGGTTTFGSGQYTFSLPDGLGAKTGPDWSGMVRAYDDSAGTKYIFGRSVIYTAGAVITAEFPGGLISPTIPMTWVNGDTLRITITYGVD